jgi:hypothetical protein
MTTRLYLSALFTAALVGACGGLLYPGPEPDGGLQAQDGGVDPRLDGGAGTGLALLAACPIINVRRCEALQRCGLIAVTQEALASCVAYFAATDCGAELVSRVQVGTLRYHSAQAAGCAQGWVERACADFGSPPEACGGLTSAAAPLQASCYGGRYRECTEGVCVGGSCPKLCRLPGTPGELCEQKADCREALYCRQASATGALGMCAEYAGQGETCDAHKLCGAGLFCARLGRCEALREEGAPCQPGACVTPAWCADGPDGGTCLARAGEGGACSLSEGCALELVCLPEIQQCAPPGPLPKDAACYPSQHCEVPLVCAGALDGGVGLCAAATQAGGDCAADRECSAELACLEAKDGGRCGGPQADGEFCAADRHCQLFSRCKQGVCERLSSLGEPCGTLGCLYGTCTQSDDGGSSCAGLGTPNAPCERDEQCQSRRCVAGACLAACSP